MQLRSVAQIILATIEWRKWNVLLLIVCLWIGWNYWAPLVALSTNYRADYREMPWGLARSDSHDFYIFYQAGRSWLSQLNPYALNGRGTGFVYPPASLPFFAVFALFDFTFASQLWWVSYFSLFVVASLALALTLDGDRRGLYISIVLLLFLTSYPLLINFWLGQIDLLITSLTVLSLVCERRKHPFASAVLLSIGNLMKGSAIFFLIYFVIFRRNFRYLTHFIVSTLVIVILSLLVVPLKLYWYYLVNVLPATYSQYESNMSQSLARLLYLGGMNRSAIQATSLVGISLFALFSFYANSNRWSDAFGKSTLRADAMFLMNGLIILLLSPRSLLYPYVWVILPVALFLSALLMEEMKMGYLMLVGFATCLLNFAIFPSFFDYRPLLPLTVIGNLIMILSLMLIYIRPTLISEKRA
jgi:hypothetical protein